MDYFCSCTWLFLLLHLAISVPAPGYFCSCICAYEFLHLSISVPAPVHICSCVDPLVCRLDCSATHREHFHFPLSVNEVSEEAQDLIQGLICARENRLGRNGVQDFKEHPFFKGIDWEGLRTCMPPFVPDVVNATDTSNFDVVDDCLTDMETLSDVIDSSPLGVHLPFVGYSYTGVKHREARQERTPEVSMEMEFDRRTPTPEAPKIPGEAQALRLADGQTVDLSAFHELQSALEEEIHTREALDEELKMVKMANQTLAGQLKQAEKRNLELEAQIKKLEERMELMNSNTNKGS